MIAKNLNIFTIQIRYILCMIKSEVIKIIMKKIIYYLFFVSVALQSNAEIKASTTTLWREGWQLSPWITDSHQQNDKPILNETNKKPNLYQNEQQDAKVKALVEKKFEKILIAMGMSTTDNKNDTICPLEKILSAIKGNTMFHENQPTTLPLTLSRVPFKRNNSIIFNDLVIPIPLLMNNYKIKNSGLFLLKSNFTCHSRFEFLDTKNNIYYHSQTTSIDEAVSLPSYVHKITQYTNKKKRTFTLHCTDHDNHIFIFINANGLMKATLANYTDSKQDIAWCTFDFISQTLNSKFSTETIPSPTQSTNHYNSFNGRIYHSNLHVPNPPIALYQ